MKILKFGGSSLSSKEGLASLSATLKRELNPKEALPVVISALENATNDLLTICHLASVGNGEFLTLLKALENRHRALIETAIAAPGQALAFLDVHFRDLGNLLQAISLVRDITPKTLDFVMSFGERLSVGLVSEYLRPEFPECRTIDARDILRTDSNFGRAAVNVEMSTPLIREAFRTPGLALVTGFIGSTDHGETTTLGRG